MDELLDPLIYATREVGDVLISDVRSMPSDPLGEIERALFCPLLPWIAECRGLVKLEPDGDSACWNGDNEHVALAGIPLEKLD